MNLPSRGPQRPGPLRGGPQPPPRGRPTSSGGRPYAPSPAKSNPLPIILGVIGVLLAVLLFVIMSPGTPAPAPPPEPPPPAKAPPPPKPVDVSGLEREGHKLCDEGLAIIRAQEPLFSKELTEAQKHQLKDDLKKGIDLIQKGMGMLSEANEKSGRTYDTTRYGEARKAASMKYHELK